jgi:hypothetical protein
MSTENTAMAMSDTMTITELAHDLVMLRAAVAVLWTISTDDPDLQNAISMINRKSFEYQGRYLSMQG